MREAIEIKPAAASLMESQQEAHHLRGRGVEQERKIFREDYVNN